jgi:peptide/nickel transport system ATP-binding protein
VSTTMPNEVVLSVEHVSVAYDGPPQVTVVRDVSLSVYSSEILGLIGESGSGKSTLAYAIMRLLKNGALNSGSITVTGHKVYEMGDEELRRFRWAQMAMVFQTAMNALNPVMTVGEQFVDTLQSHLPISRPEARLRAVELLRLVRLDAAVLNSYPHELSGGMRQRVVIGMAIALNPRLVIMDEPTTGLDVVVQRTILDEIVEIQHRQHYTILFISHDFPLVASIADRVAVMYAGKIVEITAGRAIQDSNQVHHPYTQGLIRAIPQLSASQPTAIGIPGNPPDPRNFPRGCGYQDRCPLVQEICRNENPELRPLGNTVIACHVVQRERPVEM